VNALEIDSQFRAKARLKPEQLDRAAADSAEIKVEQDNSKRAVACFAKD